MAFLVPAEIAHAPYARPLVSYLAKRFAKVLILAVRTKLFPDLSEDVWVLYTEGFGKTTDRIFFAQVDSFEPAAGQPEDYEEIPLERWESWNFRLRPFLLRKRLRDLYQRIRQSAESVLFGKVARIGIGYVTGANDFFHLRPSLARFLGIPERYLVPSLRNSRWLDGKILTATAVQRWVRRDEPVLLLRLPKDRPLEKSVQDYLESSEAERAQRLSSAGIVHLGTSSRTFAFPTLFFLT